MLVLLRGGEELDLDAVDAIDAVDEQDKNEDECDLHPVLNLGHYRILGNETVGLVSYRSEGARVLARTHVKIFRFTPKGSGRMRSINSTISSIRRTKTCPNELANPPQRPATAPIASA